MEGEIELVTIPLSKYNQIISELGELKANKESVLEKERNQFRNFYKDIIGCEINERINSIRIISGSLINYIDELEEKNKKQNEQISSLKINEAAFRDTYRMLLQHKKNLHWWQLYQRMKINRMLELIEKRVKWTQNNS